MTPEQLTRGNNLIWDIKEFENDVKSRLSEFRNMIARQGYISGIAQSKMFAIIDAEIASIADKVKELQKEFDAL